MVTEGRELVEARGALWQFVQELMKRSESAGMDPDDVARVVREAADDLSRRRAEAGAGGRWLVYTLKEAANGDVCLWWKPKAMGYTRYLEEAGRFSRDEAEQHLRGASGDVAIVEESSAAGAALRVVPLKAWVGGRPGRIVLGVGNGPEDDGA